ncbi:hypothetical protein M422DRAFT_69694 [Sphaerobolus stellatus SS14]|uniref:Uncharacterized protein n=1 Tax=Sphaerobolus stellatus (strain SS14) TaxID=990650 RepID=A0A0C9UNV1_SPHS4|nr:hypothetical protein M422DRAFT_69694 [Sphaerobolus stellatus SS14]
MRLIYTIIAFANLALLVLGVPTGNHVSNLKREGSFLNRFGALHTSSSFNNPGFVALKLKEFLSKTDSDNPGVQPIPAHRREESIHARNFRRGEIYTSKDDSNDNSKRGGFFSWLFGNSRKY